MEDRPPHTVPRGRVVTCHSSPKKCGQGRGFLRTTGTPCVHTEKSPFRWTEQRISLQELELLRRGLSGPS